MHVNFKKEFSIKSVKKVDNTGNYLLYGGIYKVVFCPTDVKGLIMFGQSMEMVYF
jgi:hypothetical protein